MDQKHDTLDALRKRIKDHVAIMDRPYTHNIITITLVAILRHYGRDAANQAVRDFGLKRHGWDEEKG